MDDASLVRRAAVGDEGAFEILVRRHAEAMWRLARSLLDDDFEAEEAVQDSFVKAYRSLGSFRAEAAVRTWLLSICYRTCIDRLRVRRLRSVPLEALPDIGTADETVDLRLALQQTIRALREEERQAFILVHVLGYSRDEAARICGVPPSTMRDRVVRARGRLAEMVDLAEALEDET